MKNILLILVILSTQFAQLKCYAALSEIKHIQMHDNEVVDSTEEDDHHHENEHSHKHRHSPGEPEHEHSHSHLNTSGVDIHFLGASSQFALNSTLDEKYSFSDKSNLRPYHYIFEIFRPPIA